MTRQTVREFIEDCFNFSNSRAYLELATSSCEAYPWTLEFPNDYIQENSTALREDGFLTKIWKTIKTYLQKFVQFWRKAFMGAKQKFSDVATYLKNLKTFTWTKKEADEFLTINNIDSKEVAKVISDSRKSGINMSGDVNSDLAKVISAIIDTQVNSEDGSVRLHPKSIEDGQNGSSPKDVSGSVHPERLFELAKELFKAETEDAIKAIEKKLKKIVDDSREDGIEIQKDDKHVNSVYKKLGKFISGVETFMSNLKKNAKDAKKEFINDPQARTPYAKVRRKVMMNEFRYFKARAIKFCSVFIKCLGKTMNTLSWYRNFSTKVRNAYRKCEAWAIEKMEDRLSKKKHDRELLD